MFLGPGGHSLIKLSTSTSIMSMMIVSLCEHSADSNIEKRALQLFECSSGCIPKDFLSQFRSSIFCSPSHSHSHTGVQQQCAPSTRNNTDAICWLDFIYSSHWKLFPSHHLASEGCNEIKYPLSVSFSFGGFAHTQGCQWSNLSSSNHCPWPPLARCVSTARVRSN